MSVALHSSGQDRNEDLTKTKLGHDVYLKQCIDCHGESGAGVEGAYEEPLIGSMTIDELKTYVAETMPEDDPGTCVGDDAANVAKFIFDKFYSVEAQNRRNPPRLVFSRLTREQHLKSVADLVASFSNRREPIVVQNGLKAVYYNSRSSRKSNVAFERVDAQLDFDFDGEIPQNLEAAAAKKNPKTKPSKPKPNKSKKREPKEFSIQWYGSLIAEESGQYELVVRSSNSVRLYFNNSATALVDANVVSGDLSEYRKKISLIGGRAYDLRISFSRHKEKQAFFQLKWIRPNGVEQIVPAKNFTTMRSLPLFVPDVTFPPDDESYGYPRGISISKEWTAAVSKTAILTAQHISKNLDRFVKPSNDHAAYLKSVEEFCVTFGERAFRSSLSDEQKRRYVTSHFSTDREAIKKDSPAKVDLKASLKKAIVLILKSPRFLYLDLNKDQPNHAFRLSMIYWDSIPNRELREAEERGQLTDKKDIDWRLEKMLDDGRARAKIESFFEYWLKLDEFKDIAKDESLFPDFDTELVEDLHESLMMQIEEVVWSKQSDFRELIAGQDWFINQNIATNYSLQLPNQATNSFQKTARVNGRGILTHPYLMTGFAYSKSSSPIHRGVFLTQRVLGRRLNPPPDSFPPFDGEIAKTWTTREKVEFQTKPDACQRCHELINNLGFALEEFDAVGRFRKLDNSKPVISSGQYMTVAGKLVKYEGANELVSKLRDDPEVQQHFVKELFQFLVKQPLAAFGSQAQERLLRHFVESEFSIKKLLVEIGKVAVFRRPTKRE